MTRLNPSLKHNLFVGLFISLWVFVFTFYIKPFDSGSDGLYWWWVFLSFGFSLLSFLCYFFMAMLQNSIHRRISLWNIFLETGIILSYLVITFYTTFLYYKSPFLRGILSFDEYLNAFLKSAIVFLPILILSRRFILKFLPKEQSKKIISLEKPLKNQILNIRGDYKLDILKVTKSDLVCISKSQNYIEIFFLENGKLKSKLMRSSLKKVNKDFDFLLQVHRSHLINPSHFKSWKNSKVISLTEIDIPVSKNYKENIANL